MVNDTEKLTTILQYIRVLDEETKKKLEKLRQANGNGAELAGVPYGVLLDRMYEVHARYQKEKEEQCRALAEKIRGIEKKLQDQCAEEIGKLVEKSLVPPRKA